MLLLRSQSASALAAQQAGSPVAAAEAGLASLERGIFASLTKAAAPPPASPSKSSGGGSSGGGGALGAGSTPGSQATTSPEDAFGTFGNLSAPSTINTGPSGAAFAPGGIFSDPSSFAGSPTAPDFTTLPTQDQTAENSLVNSMAADSSGAPQFDGLTDPNTGLAFVPDTSGSFSGVQDTTDFSSGDFSDF
jgi:hypothetical protein